MACMSKRTSSVLIDETGTRRCNLDSKTMVVSTAVLQTGRHLALQSDGTDIDVLDAPRLWRSRYCMCGRTPGIDSAAGFDYSPKGLLSGWRLAMRMYSKVWQGSFKSIPLARLTKYTLHALLPPRRLFVCCRARERDRESLQESTESPGHASGNCAIARTTV